MIRRNNRTYYKNEIVFKDMVLDLKTRKIKIEDEEVFLQGKQFDMLEYLINYKNTIITKEQILTKYGGL